MGGLCRGGTPLFAPSASGLMGFFGWFLWPTYHAVPWIRELMCHRGLDWRLMETTVSKEIIPGCHRNCSGW